MPRRSQEALVFRNGARLSGAEPWLPGDVHLWIGHLDVLESAADLHLLDADERARAASFREASGRRAFVSRRAGVKRILARYCHCSPRDLVMAKGAFGKPLLPDISFNWSKTRKYWALAIAPIGRLGVDIERVAPDVDWQELLSIFCHPIERDFIMADAAIARRRFFQVWARKEAFLKATGIGLSGDLTRMRVLPGMSRDAAGYADGIQEITDLRIETDIAGALATDFPVARILCFEQSASSREETIWNLPQPPIAA